MATSTRSRRRQTRHAVQRDAQIEFEHPTPHGRAFRVPLINVSRSGVSFVLDEQLADSGLDSGTNLPGAILRMGDCMIYGDLLIMHVTPGPQSQKVCGALFYPKSDTDLIKLRSVIAGMEASGAD